jgi:HlyD family secretion protein
MSVNVRSIIYGAVGVIAVALLLYAFLPPAVEVDVANVVRGELEVTVREDGKTRIKERYVVSTPIEGDLLRINLHAGDKVEAGKTLLAVIQPVNPNLLDVRANAESEARVKSAEAKVLHSQSQLKRAKAGYQFALVQHQRAEKLVSQNVVNQEAYDAAVHYLRTAEEDVHSGEFSVKIAEFELQQARAAQIRSSTTDVKEGDRFEIYCPVDGEILRVFQESAAKLPAGTRLMEIGDRGNLEVEVDVLSSDAVRISPGAKIYLEHWGAQFPLRARVRLIEPQAFLKVSALGVEEQRVIILADFIDPPKARQRIGDAYRVEARIVIWEGKDVLKVSAGACFRNGDGWAVYRILNGRARLTEIRIGHSSGLEVEILDGVRENDQVVAYPSDRVHDGARVVPRINRL